MTETIKKILICDDHPIIHTGIKYTLKELFPEMHFQIESVLTGRDALLKIKSDWADILFLDLNLPDISGIKILKKLQKEHSGNLKIIILTGENNLPTILQIVRYKVSGILLKSYSNTSFKEVIDHIMLKKSFIYLDSTLEQKIEKEAEKKQMSTKEFEVLSLVVRGYSNKAIAQTLACSPETIKSHLTNIARKIQINNRDDLISWFYDEIDR